MNKNQHLPRSKLKEATTHHEQEKDSMATMQAVGLSTSSYVADTALETGDKSSNDEPEDDEMNHATGPTVENGKPLLLYMTAKLLAAVTFVII